MATAASPSVRLGTLTLTSDSVRKETAVLGASSIGSIMLDQISFCGVELISQPILLLLAAIAAVLGIVGMGQAQFRDVSKYLLGGAVILVVLYFVTRQSQVTIASSGGRLSTTTRGAKYDAIRQFVNAVETARSTALHRS
jgi:hypothetical protein